MADLAPVPSSLTYVATADRLSRGYNSGEAIDAGEHVYLDNTVTPAVWRLANQASVPTSQTGVAVNSAPGAQQPITIALTGVSIALGTPAESGQLYVASNNLGKIAPHSDLTSGQGVIMVGYGDDSGNLVLLTSATGATRP